jgi:hypothetical protein
MDWMLKATVRCDALIGLGQVRIPTREGQRHDRIRTLTLERPRIVEGRRCAEASEFDLKLEVEAAGTGEAADIAPRCAEEVCASLAFLASAPAEVRGVSITNAPDEPVPDREYTTVSYADDMKFQVPPTAVPAKDTAFLILPKAERVIRALRWMQKSHFSDNALDEFTCLMVAFESLSQLLKTGGTRYWHCLACGQDIRRCPECGESTESKVSGVDAMREFVVGGLGWAETEWRTAWEWRCKLLHGEADVSGDEERAVLPCLPRLEEAVIAAIKQVSGLPQDHSPARGRHRVPFSHARLVLKWHK